MPISRGLLSVVMAAVFWLSSPASPALGGEKYYVKIEGTKQGQFRGDVQRNGSHWSEIASFAQAVETPRDATSGQASGKRQHKPITITKEPGAATPQLLQAAASNEILKEVVIQSVRIGPQGKELVYQTIKLINANVARVKKTGPKNKNEQEQIEFTFQKIEVTDVKGSVSAKDDWIAPK